MFFRRGTFLKLPMENSIFKFLRASKKEATRKSGVFRKRPFPKKRPTRAGAGIRQTFSESERSPRNKKFNPPTVHPPAGHEGRPAAFHGRSNAEHAESTAFHERDNARERKESIAFQDFLQTSHASLSLHRR